MCYGWMVTHDVYSHGVLHLIIIGKRVIDKFNPPGTLVHKWAEEEYKPKTSFFGLQLQVKCSLVHKILEEDPAYDVLDGPKITKLGMRCLEFGQSRCPMMMGTVQCLQDLRVVRKHIEVADIEAVLPET